MKQSQVLLSWLFGSESSGCCDGFGHMSYRSYPSLIPVFKIPDKCRWDAMNLPHEATKMKIGDLPLAMVKFTVCFPYQPTHRAQSYWTTATCWFPSNVASHQFSSYLYTYIFHAAPLPCFFLSFSQIPWPLARSIPSLLRIEVGCQNSRLMDGWISMFQNQTLYQERPWQSVCSLHMPCLHFRSWNCLLGYPSGMILTFGPSLFLSQLELPALGQFFFETRLL